MRSDFATTRWTVVMQAAGTDSPQQQAALSQLLTDNWFPLYTYLRRAGKTAEQAEDLIQGFFHRLLDKKLLSGIEGQQRGRFRNFLLVCLKNFVANEWQKSAAQKRGGGKKLISIDMEIADQRYTIEPVHELTPEKAFDRAWAVELIQRSMDRVARAWANAGKADKFDVLKVYLLPDDQVPSHEVTAKEIGVKPDSLKVTIHRLRAEFRRALCDEVAETLGRGDLLEDEINHLFSALES